MLTLIVTEFQRVGQFSKSLQALERARALCTAAAGADWSCIQLANISGQMGSIMNSNGLYSEALAHFREALRCVEIARGTNGLEAACSLRALANAQRMTGDLDGALASALRAHDIYTRQGEVGTLEFAELLRVFGILSSDRGNLSVALDFFTQCLAIRNWYFPPDHPEIASALAFVSNVHIQLGRPAAAADMQAVALAINRRSQTRCAGPGCTQKLREDGASLDVCVNCRRTFYCGKACQTADWKAVHRKECKALIAEAAAAQPKV